MSVVRSKYADDPRERVPFDGRYALHGGAFTGEREPPGINDAVEPSDADDGRYGWSVGVAPRSPLQRVLALCAQCREPRRSLWF